MGQSRRCADHSRQHQTAAVQRPAMSVVADQHQVKVDSLIAAFRIIEPKTSIVGLFRATGSHLHLVDVSVALKLVTECVPLWLGRLAAPLADVRMRSGLGLHHHHVQVWSADAERPQCTWHDSIGD